MSWKNSPVVLKHWKRDAFIAAGCGITAALVAAIAQYAIGSVSGAEARNLVDAMLPTTRFLCSGVMTATATILALMLTLLSMSVSIQAEFDDVHYRRIRQIAFYDMIALIVATITLVLHCIPIQKSQETTSGIYPIVYYALLLAAAALGGVLVTIVVLIYATLRDLILRVGISQEQDSADSES